MTIMIFNLRTRCSFLDILPFFFTCLAILFVTYEVELWVGVNLLTYAYKFKFN